MDFKQQLQRLNLESDVVVIAIVAIALILILLVNRRRLTMHWREWRIQRSLKRIGSEQIRNLVCADGLDGYYHIDRLALTRDAILLVSYKPYGGNIYCAERISEWTQVVEQKSFKFANPLFELENQVTALKLLIDDVPMRGYLFFNQGARFPKGHPESVLQADTIPEPFLAENCEPINADILHAWKVLKSHQTEASAGERISVKT
ncbi:MAG: NERD domain-containing protein [Gammaproteobacteria bacterium]|nr:NERD domain-containing protein [Gammaproteobacteria bacterium]